MINSSKGVRMFNAHIVVLWQNLIEFFFILYSIVARDDRVLFAVKYESLIIMKHVNPFELAINFLLPGALIELAPELRSSI